MQINCKRNTKSRQHGKNLKKDRRENSSIYQEHSDFNGSTFFGEDFSQICIQYLDYLPILQKILVKRQLDENKDAAASTP